MATSSRIAVYSGTFDPFTLGHEDVVRRAAGLFDELIIGVAVAHHKKTLFSLDARIAQVQADTRAMANVRVLPFDGLIMDFCAEQQAVAVVRGIRNLTDFDYEAQMAAMNRKLRPTVETVFLLPMRPCNASAARWCARSASWAAMSSTWSAPVWRPPCGRRMPQLRRKVFNHGFADH